MIYFIFNAIYIRFCIIRMSQEIWSNSSSTIAFFVCFPLWLQLSMFCTFTFFQALIYTWDLFTFKIFMFHFFIFHFDSCLIPPSLQMRCCVSSGESRVLCLPLSVYCSALLFLLHLVVSGNMFVYFIYLCVVVERSVLVKP